MQTEQHVRLKREGSRQMLPIPREFELASEDAMIRKEGQRLIIDPIDKPSLLALLATLEPIEEEFGDMNGDLPPLDDVLL